MCGIEGVIPLDHDLDNSDLLASQAMLGSLVHRGPDRQSEDINQGFILGHSRLSMVGGSAGDQPIHKNGRALVFNGEIYNHQDLIKSADIEKSSSDTENLFAHLAEHGITSLNELNGMFAFCYVDHEKIYLVRDRFGEKPLFYTILNGRLYFASEATAFKQIRDLELVLPDYYPNLETAIAPDTIFKDVFQLEQGHYLEIDIATKKIEKVKYYEPKIEIANMDFLEAVDELRRLLDQAIQMRLPDNQRYAAYISGGLDSTIIAMASNPHLLLSFISDSSRPESEEKYADVVADSLNSEYVKVGADSELFIEKLYELIFALSGPTTSLAALSQLVLSSTVKDHDIKTVLSGIGADEFFGGYMRHPFGFMNGLNPEKQGFAHYRPLFNKQAGLIKPIDRYAALLNRSSNFSAAPVIEKLQPLFDIYNPATAIAMADMLLTMPPLMQMDDHINMHYSVESRSPFLDHRLVELGLSLPAKFKMNIQDNILNLKHVLKTAYEDLLPPPIKKRTDKVGFPSLVNEWLSKDLSKMVVNARRVLGDVFGDSKYIFSESLDLFDRRNYQILQLAASYLIFSQGLSKDKFQQELLRD